MSEWRLQQNTIANHSPHCHPPPLFPAPLFPFPLPIPHCPTRIVPSPIALSVIVRSHCSLLIVLSPIVPSPIAPYLSINICGLASTSLVMTNVLIDYKNGSLWVKIFASSPVKTKWLTLASQFSRYCRDFFIKIITHTPWETVLWTPFGSRVSWYNIT